MADLGNIPDSPETGLPLVTFVVLSYNQEKYIREAVEAALAQDYIPLEILLSDDHSSDATYDLMEALANRYNGKAKIVLNRNESNLGIGEHVKKIADMASGEIIVMAAGDDISDSQRTREVVGHLMKNSDHHAVFSNVKLIDDSGSDSTDERMKRWLDS